MQSEYENCKICPRECGVDRRVSRGFCGCGENAVVAKTMLHFWEEPPVSGTRGSGAVFFSGCNLRCNFCQNRDISRVLVGRERTAEQLAEDFLDLEAQGAHNVNLITGAPYVPTIAEALSMAKARGLTVPVVYNSGGYEKVSTLRILDGLVDVYLPDFKYADSDLATKYSCAKDYPETAESAIDEMVRQVGAPEIRDGLIKRGVIVRYLVLPTHRDDGVRVMRRIAEKWGSKVKVSVMRQYTPDFADEDCDMRRRVTTFEYRAVLDEALRLGLDGYFQDADSATSAFTPDF